MQTSFEFIRDNDRRRIDDAVARAEQQTSGEIVPVFATAAEPYDRGMFLAGIAFALVATLILMALAFLPMRLLPFAPWQVPLFVLLPVQVVAVLIGYHLARSSPALQRAFLSRSAMQRAVRSAARRAFETFRLTHTRDATGIMIYVSLFERMAVVITDKAINEKHDQSTWDGVRDLLVKGLHSSDPARGFEDAIEACGRILSQDFPLQPDDTNELPNHLRLM